MYTLLYVIEIVKIDSLADVEWQAYWLLITNNHVNNSHVVRCLSELHFSSTFRLLWLQTSCSFFSCKDSFGSVNVSLLWVLNTNQWFFFLVVSFVQRDFQAVWFCLRDYCIIYGRILHTQTETEARKESEFNNNTVRCVCISLLLLLCYSILL